MKHNATSIQRAVVKRAQEFYGFSIQRVAFIPIGEESIAYGITDTSGREYFIKYCESPEVIQNLPSVHSVLRHLAHLDFVIPPLMNRSGESYTTVLNGVLYGYPFFNGTSITQSNQDLSKEIISRAQFIMESIHRSRIDELHVQKESFMHAFDSQYEMIRSRSQTHKNSLILQKVQDSHDTIMRIIRNHESLGEKYRNNSPRFVLTHGDITGLNMLLKDSELKLIDWDGVMRAPAERDINFLLNNPHFDTQKYLHQTGKDAINKELIEYYSQQWSLGSILGNFEMLLDNPEIDDSSSSESYAEIDLYLGYYR